MIEMRRVQLGFGDGLIAEEVSDLREDWMRHADQVLADEQIVAAVYDALAKRHPKSRSRGRLGTPAEVVLRLLILKHIRNWSYAALEREVRANLVYRDFTRVGAAKMPDGGRGSRAIGSQTDSRADGENRQGQGHHYGTANASGYDSGGDQHPPSNGQYLAWETECGC
jgi:transposase, IS5 family